MSENQANQQKKRKSAGGTPLWVKIMALAIAVLMIGTAVPLTLLAIWT